MHATITSYCPRRTRDDSGMALVLALGMLVLFAMLGVAYAGYMSIEFDRARYEVQTLRARNLASAAIYGAVGHIQAAIEKGETPGAVYTLQMPMYDQQRNAEIREVSVEVSDECARINLSFAPREVLEAIGFDRSEVRELKRNLPRDPVAMDASASWLLDVDELLNRSYVSQETFAKLDRNLLTVFSADPLKPEGYLNLNSAPPAVLAAALNLTPEEAEAVAAKRPFESWEDLLAKTGKAADTFNVRPEVGETGGMPASLAFTSRCYRLVSSASVEVSGGRSRLLQHRVEAVIQLDENGEYHARYWREESGTRDEEELPAVEVAEVETIEAEAPPAEE